MNDLSKQHLKTKDERRTSGEEEVSANSPVTPVDAFDLGKADQDRRIFQNGDTDRKSDQD
jgi:hypothetical protein